MPRKPASPCRQFGCPALVDGGGYCETHRKQRQNSYARERRSKPETSDSFYWSTRWRKVRKQHLIDEPLCRECKKAGRVTAATIVDHIDPIKQGGDKWDPENHQSLCDTCHSRKSAIEGSRWG